MSEILVSYVVSAEAERLLALSLEDLALCQAWYTSYMGVPEVRAAFDALPGKVAQWTSDKQDPGGVTQGARQQPLLRHVLGRLSESGQADLTRDEADFLFFVYELIGRTKHRNQFRRPLELIAQYMPDIERLRETMEPVHGLPSVLKRVGVATEVSIAAAPRRTIGGFGGLPLEFRGPVLRHGEALKVVGDIPDGTAVVVEGDACYVSGYVLGKLLVRGHTEVRENISGMVICEHGNVRARGIVNRGTVIAKRGRVRVGSAEAPDLVYGGTQIRINEFARLGRYFAPRIRVGGIVSGAACHVTALLQAGSFTGSGQREMEIVLRAELGCEDYGEDLQRNAKLLLRTAARLQKRIDHLQQLMAVQQDEAEHYACTALLYICSAQDSQKDLQAVNALKRRRAFLVRMLTGLHLLTTSLLERLRECQGQADVPLSGAAAASAQVSAERSIQSVLNEVSRELAQLKVEGDFPQELDQEWSELMEVHGASSRSGSEGVLSRAILRFHEARKAWRSELGTLDGQIRQVQEFVARDESRKVLVERAQKGGTSQTALAQLIRAARERGADDPVMKRVATPFIKRMLTLLQKRNQWVERYHKEIGEHRAELNEAQRRLLEEFNINPAQPTADTRITGCFDAGVHLYVGEAHALAEGVGRGTALATGDSQGSVWTFGLLDGEIVRLAED